MAPIRLTAVAFKTSSGTLTKQVTYGYDTFDRRVRKSVDDDGNGTVDRTERYVYDFTNKTDGSTDVSLDDVVLTFDGSGALTHRYLHGADIDELFADETATGAVLWALDDEQGTIRDWAEYNSGTNTTTVTDHLKYDSFGRITSQSNSSHTVVYAFTGREWDKDVDLQYNRMRWYDPVVGRWISEDPIGFAGGDANLVRYVGNNPVNFEDPSGLIWEDKVDSSGGWGSNSQAGGWNPFGPNQPQTRTGKDRQRSRRGTSIDDNGQPGPGEDPNFKGGVLPEDRSGEIGFGNGIKTGAKGLVNGLTGSLGLGIIPIAPVFPPDPETDIGIEVSTLIGCGIGSTAIGIGAGAAAGGAGLVCAGGRIVQGGITIGSGIQLYDGVTDAATNGIDWGNGTKIAGGVAGLGGGCIGRGLPRGRVGVRAGVAGAADDVAARGGETLTAGNAPRSSNGGFSGRKGFELKNHPSQPARNSPATIGERQISGHAMDQMQNRGIPPSVVDNAIKHGVPFPGNLPGTQGFFDPINRVRVIINSDTGNVITVIPGGG